jgi:hypothetical protein
LTVETGDKVTVINENGDEHDFYTYLVKKKAAIFLDGEGHVTGAAGVAGEIVDLSTVVVKPGFKKVNGKIVPYVGYTYHKAIDVKPEDAVASTRGVKTYGDPFTDIDTDADVKHEIDKLRSYLVKSYNAASDKAEYLADPGTRDEMKRRALFFNTVRSSAFKKPKLGKAGKIMSGREWGRYDSLVWTSRLLSRMKNKTIEKDEAKKLYDALMSERLVPKVFGKDYPIPVDQMRQLLIKGGKDFGIDTNVPTPEVVKKDAPVVHEELPEVEWAGGGKFQTKEGDKLFSIKGESALYAVLHVDGSVDQVNEHHDAGSAWAKAFHEALESGGSSWLPYDSKHVVTKKVSKPAKKKVSKHSDTVTLPDGSEYHLEPGESAWTILFESATVTTEAATGKPVVGIHHVDGTDTVYYPPEASSILPSPKKFAKGQGGAMSTKNGWTKIGAGASLPKEAKPKKVPFPSIPLTAEEKAIFTQSTGEWNTTPLDKFIANFRNPWPGRWNAFNSGNEFNGNLETPADLFEVLETNAGKVEAARADPSLNLSSSEKSKLARERKRWLALAAGFRLLVDAADPQVDSSDLEPRMQALKDVLDSTTYSGPYAKLFTKGSSSYSVSKWPYSQENLWVKMGTAIDKRLFEDRKADLGFDLDAASHATLVNFLADKGAADIAPFLTDTQQRQWIRVWLHDPEVLGELGVPVNADKFVTARKKLEAVAKTKLALDKVVKASNLDLHETEKEKQGQVALKAFTTKLLKQHKRFELEQSLKSSYTGSGSGTSLQQLDQLPDGSWRVKKGAIEVQAGLSTEQVLDKLSVESVWKPDPSAHAAKTPYQIDAIDGFKLIGTTDKKPLNSYLKERGAEFVVKMSSEEKWAWIRAHLAQNNLEKFAIEERAGHKSLVGKPLVHPGKLTHPGSPDSPEGKIARQMLSDQAAISDWGESYRLNKPVKDWKGSEVVQFATALHLVVPPPLDGTPSEAAAREAAKEFVYWVPGSKLPPPSPGLTTAIPSLSPTALVKTDAIGDDQFELYKAFLNAKPGVSPMEEFSTQAASLTDEQATKKIKSNAVFTNSPLTREGLLHMPLPLKQLFLVSTYGMLTYERDKAGLPGDSAQNYDASNTLSKFILDRVEKGDFDPPKPEGYYGAISEGNEIYYLKPGDTVLAPGFDAPVGAFTEVAGFKLKPGDVAFKWLGATMVLHADKESGWWVKPGQAKKPILGNQLLELKHWESSKNPDIKKLGEYYLNPPKPLEHVLYVQHGDGKIEKLTANGMQETAASVGDFVPYLPKATTSVPAKKIGTYKQATALGFSGDEEAWKRSEKIDALSKDWVPSNFILDDATVEQALRTSKATYSIVVDPAFYENAPMQVKRAMLNAIVDKDTALVDALNWKAVHGHYGYRSYTPPFPKDKPYSAYILAGMTSESDISTWPVTARNAFRTDYDLDVSTIGAVVAISTKIQELLHGELIQLPQSTTGLAAPLKFKKLEGAPALGGMHTKSVYADQFDGKWLVKPYQSDPYPKMRVDQETYAARISNLLGFHAPPVQDPLVLDGEYGYVQSMVPKKFDMTGIAPETLDDSILTQVAEEHVLDWVISNHDTYFENLFVSGDGKYVVGIDKGQAFKHFPDDKLAIGYKPPENGHPVYYDQLYNAVVSHKISKERADEVVTHLLKRAKRVAYAHDPEYRENLERAFANRSVWPAEYPTKEAFIDALVDRKHHVAEDFQVFWKSIYEKAEYEWDIPPLSELTISKVETDRGTAWAGTSQELFDTVQQAQIHGISAMYAGEDLEDGTLLFYTEHEPDQSQTLIGEGKLRRAADKRFTKWLQEQSPVNQAGSPTTAVPFVAPLPTELPNASSWYATIVTAAKTVNKHQTDGEYNASTLATMNAELNLMEHHKKELEAHLATNPNSPYDQQIYDQHLTFVSLADEKAYVEMLKTYIGYIGEINTAKQSQQKTPSKSYSVFVYKPTPPPKVLETWKKDDETLEKLEDGTWKWTAQGSPLEEGGPGSHVLLSEEQAQEKIKAGGWTAGKEVKSSTSAAVKVFRRKNNRPSGALNVETGELEIQSGSAGGTPGYEYDVEIGDKLSVEYLPWEGDGVAPSQQGTFRIRVKEWQGDEDSFEPALAQLAAMGVDLTPADDEALELLYWHQMIGMAENRADTAVLSSAGVTVKKPPEVISITKEYAEWKKSHPNASRTEELAFLRLEWAKYVGKDGVANADWMPHFTHFRPQTPDLETGKPYWNRADASIADVDGHFLSHYYTTSQPPLKIAKSGGLAATEERLRMYGQFFGGKSPDSDQGYGSAAFLFTKPNESAGGVILSPLVWLRMSTFSFDADNFGNIGNRKSISPYTLQGMFDTNKGSGNSETQVKNGVSVLDDIDVMNLNSQTSYQEAVAWYKARGITQVRGIPIEDIFWFEGKGLGMTAQGKINWQKEKAWYLAQKQVQASNAQAA